MAAKTRIEWAANRNGTPGATWNPIRARDRETGRTGTWCVHASEGCRNCYAETFQARGLPANGLALPYAAQYRDRVEIFLDEQMLAAPLRRRKPTTWFLSSMTDVFGEWVPDRMLDRLFAVMALSPGHIFVVLTKRAARMRDYVSALQNDGDVQKRWLSSRVPAPYAGTDKLFDLLAQGRRWTVQLLPLPNVILGVSVEDQANAVLRIPDLLATPAACLAVSCEPLLSPLDLTALPRPRADGFMRPLDGRFNTLDWVICGGESGANARAMHPEWARSLRDQCALAGVPFFFKQWGEWLPIDNMGEELLESLYEPAPARDPEGRRRCKVLSSVLHGDGTTHDPVAAGSFEQGTDAMTIFRVGKHRAGRLLDGQEHNGRPALFAPDPQQGEGPSRDARDTTRPPSPGRSA